MTGLFYIFTFIGSCILLFWAGNILVKALMGVAHFLKWKEFTVSLFVMATAASIPNLFIGISSAIHQTPQLSFGDVIGGNIVDLTLGVGIATLIAKGLPTAGRTVQTSSIFTMVVAILPLLLILDGRLGRIDGIILISFFLFYIFWLFSKRKSFRKSYQEKGNSIIRRFKIFLKDVGRVILGTVVLLLAAEGVVRSASFFAQSLKLPLSLVGVLIVGVGNTLPEIYFAGASAKSGRTWMILGDLMGSVIVPSSLVLGTVALLCPIEIGDFCSFLPARFFLIVSAIFFFFFARTGQRITKREALFLFLIYILFLFVQWLTNYL